MAIWEGGRPPAAHLGRKSPKFHPVECRTEKIGCAFCLKTLVLTLAELPPFRRVVTREIGATGWGRSAKSGMLEAKLGIDLPPSCREARQPMSGMGGVKRDRCRRGDRSPLGLFAARWPVQVGIGDRSVLSS